MIPLELKIDKEGLLYYENDKLLMESPLRIGDWDSFEEKYYNYSFYDVLSNHDYIVKFCSTVYTRKERLAIKEMLKKLIAAQDRVKSVDFPIGYYVLNKRLYGTIIKYYPNALSLDKITEDRDINSLNKYYYHDDDSIHNLFLLFNDVLNSLMEMYNQSILYFDSNPGNIVLYNNEAKIIDFDFRFIKFDQNYYRLPYLFENYISLVKVILESYDIDDKVNGYYSNYEETKDYVKKLERVIRKR